MKITSDLGTVTLLQNSQGFFSTFMINLRLENLVLL